MSRVSSCTVVAGSLSEKHECASMRAAHVALFLCFIYLFLVWFGLCTTLAVVATSVAKRLGLAIVFILKLFLKLFLFKTPRGDITVTSNAPICNQSAAGG